MNEEFDSDIETKYLNEEKNELIIPSNNNNIPFNKLYISGLIIIILIFSFNMVNKDTLKKELKKELTESLNNTLKEFFDLKQLEINLKQNSEQSLKKSEDNLKQYLSQYIENNLKKYLKEILASKTKSDTKVCLCVIGKKENLYAKEFVNYYKLLGYNHIFIYDNNNKEDERFEEVLNEEISKNFVTIIDYRGYRGKKNKPQFEAYYDCYNKNSKDYDWLSFYDFDEFLYLKNNKNIQELLDDPKFSQCINIKINWLLYADNDLIYYENKPVQERFITPLPKDSANKHIKSTIRGHLKENYWKNMRNPHSSYNNLISCDPTGQIIDSKSPFNTPANYEVAYIKHYVTKTIEEFIEKAKRGRADLLVKIDNNYWKEKFKYFFEINKKTKEKLDFIKKTLNIDIA